MEEVVRDYLIGFYNCCYVSKIILVCIDIYGLVQFFVFVLIDFDYFKQVNDCFGYDVGDNVFIVFVQILLDRMFVEGCVFCFGGEEFLIVVFGVNEVEMLMLM